MEHPCLLLATGYAEDFPVYGSFTCWRVTFDCRSGRVTALHALRHTFLTEAGRHTQNVRALQKLAGHTRIETTMRYVHPDQEDVLEIAARVQAARTERIQTAPATVSATSSQQQAAESRKI